MTAPFDMFGEFEMNATCFDGTIYIEENQAAKAAERQASLNQNQRDSNPMEKMMFWGK